MLGDMYRAIIYARDSNEMVSTGIHDASKSTDSKSTPKNSTAYGEEVGKDASSGIQRGNGANSGASEDSKKGSFEGWNSVSAKTAAKKKTVLSLREVYRPSNEDCFGGKSGISGFDEGGKEHRGKSVKDGDGEVGKEVHGEGFNGSFCECGKEALCKDGNYGDCDCKTGDNDGIQCAYGKVVVVNEETKGRPVDIEQIYSGMFHADLVAVPW